MTEATGFEARTIHRLLEVDPKGGGFKRGDDNPLDCDLLVVDEASMVDVMLMQSLINDADKMRADYECTQSA
jgi:exodeoxyribonuclease V alpha subunit